MVITCGVGKVLNNDDLISSAYISIILQNREGITSLDFVGILILGIGFYFEARAYYELKMFKSDKSNKGKILTSGLLVR